MTFKKSIALLLSGSMLAAAALTGCGSDNTASAVSNTAGKDLLDQIQARGSITVAMEGTWAPWTYHDENDELVGYDVEVAKLIANELGVDVNFVAGRMRGPRIACRGSPPRANGTVCSPAWTTAATTSW